MSQNTVEQIYNAIISEVATVLGATWKRLSKVYEPDQNNLRNLDQGYGVRHAEASTFADAIDSFVLNQKFDVLLAKRASNRDSDITIQSTLNGLYTQGEAIFIRIVDNKLGLSGLVLAIGNLAMEAPKVLNDGCVLLTMSFEVKYAVDR